MYKKKLNEEMENELKRNYFLFELFNDEQKKKAIEVIASINKIYEMRNEDKKDIDRKEEKKDENISR